ncbi:hypothetical protein GDO81_023427 [Engystomops pustulosus]|uniref:Uncharacterized protein n=1 Tax=Engystomops pustulosus TaxID=76066 RepID=A0AAV6Z955_ENGPU|nr:hypothetical protein GDO81_023427 [Engystomops pustulosus]
MWRVLCPSFIGLVQRVPQMSLSFTIHIGLLLQENLLLLHSDHQKTYIFGKCQDKVCDSLVVLMSSM